MNGFFNIYKPQGMTSSDVVVKLRGMLRRQTGVRYKVGHLGTLDPAAEGVLPIAVGSATKLFNYMLGHTKVYRATFVWGVETDTLDATGTRVTEGPVVTDEAVVMDACRSLIGTYSQIPPQYSAKSVNGVRAYDLARKGIEVELPARSVTIYDMQLVSCQDNAFTFDITCSAGTYIRAICRDMAAQMGTVGYMQSLLRTRSGDFTLADTVTLQDVEQDYYPHFVPLVRFADSLPVLAVEEDKRSNIQNGVVYPAAADAPLVRVDIGGIPYAIGHTPQGILKIICRL